MNKFERVDNARVKLRVKYLTSLINKMYRGEKLTPSQHEYLNKNCQIKVAPANTPEVKT